MKTCGAMIILLLMSSTAHAQLGSWGPPPPPTCFGKAIDTPGQNIRWTFGVDGKIETSKLMMCYPAIPGWEIVAYCDVNRDGNPDLIWWNVLTGEFINWLLDSEGRLHSAFRVAIVDKDWTPKGCAVDSRGVASLILRYE